MTEVATLLTADEFLSDPAYKGWELVDGMPKEVCMGLESNAVGLEVAVYIRLFLRANPGLGRVFGSDLRLRIWPNRPNLIRRPDVTFVRAHHLPSLKSGELKDPPDLVVEVISLHEDALTVEAKRTEYLDAGVPLIWVLYPETQTVYIFRQNNQMAILGATDTLSGEDVLPGFSVPVADLFPVDEAASGS